ncbi:thiol-disulfide isomerase/thioredoxin [Peptoniphilus olsenii]|uniref:Thiol-disulfide isomerase/thioredoxin n=1 Tax=Peptoniphilus olsenii TaxID=411570 RepID=A0ABV2JB20_9FIRM
MLKNIVPVLVSNDLFFLHNYMDFIWVLILLILTNFYLNGYLRDYSIYKYDFLYKTNLIIFPCLILLYEYLKKDLQKLKIVLYVFLIFLLVFNFYLNTKVNKSISEYKIGSVNSTNLINIDKNYVGKIYFYRDDCPACEQLTEKIKDYNKKRERKILMYNTNVSSSIKKIVIEKYNVSYVPMVIEIDDKGNTKDITAEFIKNNNL